MKVYWSVVFSLLIGVSLWGQATPNPAPAPQPSQAAMQPGMPGRPLSSVDASYRMQLTRQFALELQQMRTKLGEMKTNDANIKDPAVRKHLQLDAELWDLMFSHMNEVTTALMQLKSTPSSMSPAAQMYRRQMMQERMGPAPTPMAIPTQPAPAQSQPPAPATAPAPSQP